MWLNFAVKKWENIKYVKRQDIELKYCSSKKIKKIPSSLI